MPTVAVTTQPTYNVGPTTGFRAQGTIQGQDGEFKDDLLVQGDLEVVGTLYTDTVTFGDDLTLAADKDFTMGTNGSGTGTVKTGTGDIALNGDVTVASGKDILMVEAGAGTFYTGTGDIHLNGDITVAKGMDIACGAGGGVGAGTFSWNTSGTFGTSTGAVSLNGDTTVASTKALIVTSADKLTVAGKIVPQEMILNIPVPADAALGHWAFIAHDAWMITAISEVHSVASTGAATLQVCKCTSAQAATAGVAMHKTPSTLDMQTTADTNLPVTALSDTASDYTLAAGDRIGLKSSASTAGLIGGIITIKMKRV